MLGGAAVKFPKIAVRKVRADGLSGVHFLLFVGAMSFAVSISWAKEAQ